MRAAFIPCGTYCGVIRSSGMAGAPKTKLAIALKLAGNSLNAKIIQVNPTKSNPHMNLRFSNDDLRASCAHEVCGLFEWFCAVNISAGHRPALRELAEQCSVLRGRAVSAPFKLGSRARGACRGGARRSVKNVPGRRPALPLSPKWRRDGLGKLADGPSALLPKGQ